MNKKLNNQKFSWKKIMLSTFITLSVVAFVITLVQIYCYVNNEKKIEQEAKQHAKSETMRVVGQLDERFRELMNIARDFADQLSSVKLDKADIFIGIKDVMNKNTELFGFGVAFAPYAYSEDKKLFAPYCVRKDYGLEFIQVESYYDYTDKKYEWYNAPMEKGATWVEPYFGNASKSLLAEFTVPFYVNDDEKKTRAGVVYIDYTLDDIKDIMASLGLGKTGYGYIISKKGNFISHVEDEYVKGLRSIFSVADEVKNKNLKTVGKKAINGESGIMELESEVTGKSSWVIYQPIPSTKWSLGAVFLKDEVPVDNDILRRQLIKISISTIVFLFFLLIILFDAYDGNTQSIWKMSISFTVLLVVAIGFIWYLTVTTPPTYPDESTMIVDRAGLNTFLDNQSKNMKGLHLTEPICIPTGIFVQSMEFSGSNNVNVTGYIWQKYTDGVHDGISKGFILPEAISQSIVEAYRYKSGRIEVIGWQFKVTLRQDFNYFKYPFDIKDVWIIMQHKDFDKNVMLTPDLDSYKIIKPTLLPGVETCIPVPGWNLKSSYFSYYSSSYNTNFGLKKYKEQEKFNDLYFTVNMTRNFMDPFISNMLPIIVIAYILFAILMMITNDGKKKDIFGTKVSGILSTCSGLFFSALIAHTKLRGDLGVKEIIYMEYFYIVLYISILIVSIDAFVFSMCKNIAIVQYRDNLVLRVLYWPIFMGLLLGITLKIFY